ncbi:MAG: phosphoketolase family protein [Eisenbergiella massiliensis]|uniref:phosphoketolase family protein n=1 Tax=Eisenbergiella massiliensis TaxID=1720294 RepID=UPI003991A21B
MDDIINKVDSYWRAANYLTVANMFLDKNKFLSRSLHETDLKKFPAGHWGTCPGINFIYAHLNNYIQKYRRRIQLIIGPGHAGNALLANLQLEQVINPRTATLQVKLYNNMEYTFQDSFIRTEVNPFMPGTIYDGGELGYSLAVAIGAVMDAPDTLCVCVIGDGEAETGTLSASWMCCREFLNKSSGLILPILHLNEFKMGNKSILSTWNNEELKAYFGGMGYIPRIISDNYHSEMMMSLDWVEKRYQEIAEGKDSRLPLLILRSPKGWTAPAYGNFIIESTLIAHKNPLHNLNITEKKEYLDRWLHSYHPENLFDSDGNPLNEVTSIIPDDNWRIGNSLSIYKREKLKMPHTIKYSIDIQNVREYKNVYILKDYLTDLILLNKKSFRIVSPDELKSNLLDCLKSIDKNNIRIMEILNENICQAWMQGYTLTGRNSLMISYEAFMPIISSMVSQYAKWLYQARKVSWRMDLSSLTYLVTSLCWANTYSHQNPEFINSLLGQQYDFIRIYLPIDANSLLLSMEESFSEDNRINVIISTKQKMPQWMDACMAKAAVLKGYYVWDKYSNSNKKEPDIVIAAAGDYPMRECYKAIEKIKELLPSIHIKFISILELTTIGSTLLYPHAIAQDEFSKLFSENSPILFCYHGYSTAIQMLLYERSVGDRITILGYENKSILSMNDVQKMALNGCSRYHIVLNICKLLLPKGLISDELYENITKDVTIALMREFVEND